MLHGQRLYKRNLSLYWNLLAVTWRVSSWPIKLAYFFHPQLIACPNRVVSSFSSLVVSFVCTGWGTYPGAYFGSMLQEQAPSCVPALRSLSNDDVDGIENVISKYDFSFRNSFTITPNCLTWEICWRTVQGLNNYEGHQSKEKEEQFVVTRSRSRQNLKFGHFTLLFRRGKEMYQTVKRTCRAIVFAH